MSGSDGEVLAEGRYRSRKLAAHLPEQLELITRSHRGFCARAVQEVHRAERYCQYASLIIVHADRAGVCDPSDPYQDMVGPVADLCTAVRAGCRESDLVSGVEGGKFAVLLVESGADGARQFCDRLREIIENLLPGHAGSPENTDIPVELITFPDQGTGSVPVLQALNDLYRRANTRPHLS